MSGWCVGSEVWMRQVTVVCYRPGVRAQTLLLYDTHHTPPPPPSQFPLRLIVSKRCAETTEENTAK